MTLTRKVLLGALALVALVVLLIIGFVLWVLSPDADYTQTLKSETISAPVDIYRDETGVPHIYAENYKDAAFAVGYVQGQDRGWQMESLRRAVEGRTSEFLGGLTIDLDKQFLAAGVSRLADLSLSEYDDDTREILQAYVNGVNASIEAGEYEASPEFRLFRVEAEPWTLRQAGSLPYIIGGMFEAGGLRELRARTLTSDLGEERARMIVRDFETTWPTLFRDVGALDTVSAKTIAVLEEAGLPLSARASIPTGSFTEGEEEGTNFFVLGPEKTTTGGAILATDPHLELDAPNLYYPVSITLPDEIIRGAAWITTPSIHFGHNSNIAFGMTAMVVDHRHLVVEKIDPDDPASYIRPEGSFKFELVEYDIPVRGQDEPEKFTVRYTQDGPVVSDHFEQMTELAAEYGPGYVIVDKSAVRGKGQFFLESGLKIPRARNWEEYRSAALKHGSGNTFVFADVEGNIGVQASAHIPVRKSPETWADIPRAWLGEGQWHGFAPGDALPGVLNPPRPWIADSNSRGVPLDYPLFITARASSPYRIKRSETVLAEDRRFSFDDVVDLQLDSVTTRADVILDAVTPFMPSDMDATDIEAWDKLLAWDRDMKASRPEPLLYTGFEHALHKRLIGEKVSNRRYAEGRGDPITLARLLGSDDAPFWCDSKSTPDVEDCSTAVHDALTSAVAELSKHHGSTLDDWQWGENHEARFAARYGLDFLPIISDWAAPTTIVDAGPGTLNVGAWGRYEDGKFPQTSGAVWRQVIDLANLDNSRFQIAPGVSGNATSPLYDNTLDAWSNGEYFSLVSNREELISQNASHTRFDVE